MTTVFTTRNSMTLTICLNVKDRMRMVTFAPPVFFGNVYESTFTTSNDDVIEALKKHSSFGVKFFVKKEILSPTTTNSKPTVKSIEDELKDPETAVYDETVTTKGMAVAYIQGNYDDVFTATTVEEMKREAAQKWNVIFKNWGK